MHISTHRAFTSSQSGNVFFAPGDIAVTYDINPLYGARSERHGTVDCDCGTVGGAGK